MGAVMTRPSKAKDSDLAAMQNDEDIKQEADALQSLSLATPQSTSQATRRAKYVPLNWRPGMGGHKYNDDTKQLFTEVGGREAMARATTLFYKKAFQDPQIDQFIRSHADPHGARFADWVAEKFGHGQPWSQERRSRKTCPFQSHGHTFQTPHDRSSSHYAAWHSPKRLAGQFGRHFKLDDCRIWMRLHFWAMREAGLFEASPAFCEYYIKLIGHFVSIYERSAPPFAREAARWSENQKNIDTYLKNNRVMKDVTGVSFSKAFRGLPVEEQEDERWPYEY